MIAPTLGLYIIYMRYIIFDINYIENEPKKYNGRPKEKNL